MADQTALDGAPIIPPADSVPIPEPAGLTEQQSAAATPEVPKEGATEEPKPANAAPSASGAPEAIGGETADKPENATNLDGPGPDAEAKDTGVVATEDVAPSADATEGPNGTPASKKPGKRKSVGGVPEHKGRKLNKKKSMVTFNLEAKPGEYYLAHMKGDPAWPAIICDEEMLPEALLVSRPVSAKRQDGTYRDEFQDGGKRVNERKFPVFFLGANQFSWMANSALSRLDPEECKNIEDKGRKKGLHEAFKIAAEGHDLDYFKEVLAAHEAAIQEDQDRLAEKEAAKEAAKAAKAEAKARRQSKAKAPKDEDVEMEDVADGDGEKATKKQSKKRKKEADSDEEGGKPAKTPKQGDSTKKATKLKLSTPKTPNGTPSAGKSKASTGPKSAKAKAAVKKSADSEVETPKVEERPLSAAELKARKEKEVLYLRHKLQKGFLTRDQEPKDEEMKTMSDYITKLETFADLEVSIIRTTKINKVLKAIIKLSSIPRDEEFNFRKRSHDLLASWNKILASDTETPGGGSTKDETTTNGIAKEEKLEESGVEGKDNLGTENHKETMTTEKTHEPVVEKETEKSVEKPPVDVTEEAGKIAEEVKKDEPVLEKEVEKPTDVPATQAETAMA